MNERDELQAARQEIKNLKAALADAHVDWLLESSFLDIACQRLGTTAEALKKRTPSGYLTCARPGGDYEPETDDPGALG